MLINDCETDEAIQEVQKNLLKLSKKIVYVKTFETLLKIRIFQMWGGGSFPRLKVGRLLAVWDKGFTTCGKPLLVLDMIKSFMYGS